MTMCLVTCVRGIARGDHERRASPQAARTGESQSSGGRWWTRQLLAALCTTCDHIACCARVIRIYSCMIKGMVACMSLRGAPTRASPQRHLHRADVAAAFVGCKRLKGSSLPGCSLRLGAFTPSQVPSCRASSTPSSGRRPMQSVAVTGWVLLVAAMALLRPFVSTTAACLWAGLFTSMAFRRRPCRHAGFLICRRGVSPHAQSMVLEGRWCSCLSPWSAKALSPFRLESLVLSPTLAAIKTLSERRIASPAKDPVGCGEKAAR